MDKMKINCQNCKKLGTTICGNDTTYFSCFKEKDKRRSYRIKTKFIFEGYFDIVADNRQQAKEYVLDHCDIVVDGKIHSTLPYDECKWYFDIHPKKKVR